MVPATLLRRGLWVLGIIALILGALVVAIPYAASNRIVRDRIALEMSAWSGYRVAIGAAPEIRIWPDLRAILTDVTLSPWNGTGTAIEARQVEIELSPLAALGGDVVFSTARLIEPILRLERPDAGFYLPPSPGGGRIARSIKTAQDIVAENRANPDTARLPSDPFGIVEFTGGSIVVSSPEGEATIVTGLSGQVEWPALNRPGFAKAVGVWRGEEITLDASSSNPLILMGGGAASISVTLRSAPVSFRFDGTADLTGNAYFDGKGKFLTPSLREMLEWSQPETPANLPTGSVGIEAKVAGGAQRIRFEEATVFLDDNPGRGVLDLVLTGKLPLVSGTLAFDTLDLRSFLSAFTPLEPAAGAGPGMIDAGFADRISFDLRLSAATATADSIALANVAATARINESFAAFDISDAEAFGGNIQAGIRFQRKGDGADVEMRLLASDIDGVAFGAATGSARLMPAARGNISLILKGPGGPWNSILEGAHGSISANFGPGTLPGLDLDSFVERARLGGFFALDDVADGALPIDSADFKASVAGGVARIEKAEAKSALMRILLSGIVPYEERGLALSGRIESADQAAVPIAPVGFFVGGSWSAPFISPSPGADAPSPSPAAGGGETLSP